MHGRGAIEYESEVAGTKEKEWAGSLEVARTKMVDTGRGTRFRLGSGGRAAEEEEGGRAHRWRQRKTCGQWRWTEFLRGESMWIEKSLR